MLILFLSDSLPGVFLHELPSEILVQICQYLTVQECVRGIGLVCKRFHSVIQCSCEIWKTLQTDVEFSTESSIYLKMEIIV